MKQITAKKFREYVEANGWKPWGERTAKGQMYVMERGGARAGIIVPSKDNLMGEFYFFRAVKLIAAVEGRTEEEITEAVCKIQERK